MKKITEISGQYLKKFLKHAEKALNYEPIILGGWAVYALTKKEKSIDIDVLIKSKKEIAKLKPFFDQNGFKMGKDRLGNISFERKLESIQTIGGIKIEQVIFDIMTINEPNKLHENKNIAVPWKLAFDYSTRAKISGKKVQIVAPELLLAYKAKALRDRIFDKYHLFEHMQHKRVWAARKDFKIEKDRRDIKNLIHAGKIDFKKLEEILNKTKFKEMFEHTLKEETGRVI
ncbi:MAG: hypothetical protein V1494_01835 [Candidatus Diapherotrites archaeon]